MDRFFHDKTNGPHYELVGDYYLPCLKVPESPKVGRFGIMYHNYLRNHKRVAYSGLLLSGKLNEHLQTIDSQVEEMFDTLIEQMKKAEGITEQLKAANQMKWVQLMNNIRNRAEEIVRNDRLFT